MAVAFAELSLGAAKPAAEPGTIIGVMIVCECPLFRVGLRAFLSKQRDVELLGEATHQEDVLLLAREQRPAITLLDGDLTTADPLHLVSQLRQLGVRVLVFAPAAGDEETLFRFLVSGAMAYEDPYLDEDELLAKVRRVSCGECLVTGDVLLAQAARRRLASLRLDTWRAASFAEALLPAQQGGNARTSACACVDDDLLTPRQRAILEQIARGQTNAQVAQALGVSPYTVKNNLNDISASSRCLIAPWRLSGVCASSGLRRNRPCRVVFCILAIRSGRTLLEDAHCPADG